LDPARIEKRTNRKKTSIPHVCLCKTNTGKLKEQSFGLSTSEKNNKVHPSYALEYKRELQVDVQTPETEAYESDP
jgi:hypothetical protein